jgi:hypothetical protein
MVNERPDVSTSGLFYVCKAKLVVYIHVNQKNKIMFIKIDYEMGFSSICDNEEEVIEGCGYDVDEITFEELLEQVKGVFEIIKVEGSVEFLND